MTLLTPDMQNSLLTQIVQWAPHTKKRGQHFFRVIDTIKRNVELNHLQEIYIFF